MILAAPTRITTSTPRGVGTPTKQRLEKPLAPAGGSAADDEAAGQTRTLNLTVKRPRALVLTVTALRWLQICLGTTHAVAEHSTIVSFLCRLNPEPVSVVFLFTITLSGLATIFGRCLAGIRPTPVTTGWAPGAAAAAALAAPTPTPATSTAVATSMTRFTTHLTSTRHPFRYLRRDPRRNGSCDRNDTVMFGAEPTSLLPSSHRT